MMQLDAYPDEDYNDEVEGPSLALPPASPTRQPPFQRPQQQAETKPAGSAPALHGGDLQVDGDVDKRSIDKSNDHDGNDNGISNVSTDRRAASVVPPTNNLRLPSPLAGTPPTAVQFDKTADSTTAPRAAAATEYTTTADTSGTTTAVAETTNADDGTVDPPAVASHAPTASAVAKAVVSQGVGGEGIVTNDAQHKNGPGLLASRNHPPLPPAEVMLSSVSTHTFHGSPYRATGMSGWSSGTWGGGFGAGNSRPDRADGLARTSSSSMLSMPLDEETRLKLEAFRLESYVCREAGRGGGGDSLGSPGIG